MMHVLIVDDDAGIREIVRDLLEEELPQPHDRAYSVVATAANGQEALDRLRAENAPTIVIFDLVMPVMDGEAFLRQALADPALAARCAFICFPATRARVTPALARLLAAHGIPLVYKPFDIDHLLAVVVRVAQQFDRALTLRGSGDTDGGGDDDDGVN